MKFRLKNEESTLNICRSMKQSSELQSVYPITYSVESERQVECLVLVLKRFKRSIGCTIVEIIEIPPGICS